MRGWGGNQAIEYLPPPHLPDMGSKPIRALGWLSISTDLQHVNAVRQLFTLYGQDPCRNIRVASDEFGGRGHANVDAERKRLLEDWGLRKGRTGMRDSA